MLTKTQFDQLVNTHPNTGADTNEPSIAQLVYRYYRLNLWDTNDTEAAEYTERYLSALLSQMQDEAKEKTRFSNCELKFVLVEDYFSGITGYAYAENAKGENLFQVTCTKDKKINFNNCNWDSGICKDYNFFMYGRNREHVKGVFEEFKKEFASYSV